jgi:Leucine rich repeat
MMFQLGRSGQNERAVRYVTSLPPVFSDASPHNSCLRPFPFVWGAIVKTGVLDRITTSDKNGQFDVDIAQLELDEWPQELVIVAKVKIIVAFKNKFTHIPTLQDFRSLEHLDLSRNRLTSIDSVEFIHLVKLKHLDVSRNRIERLPDDLTKCPVLERLIVHRNRLTAFPDDMNNLRYLRFIDASHNFIAHVGLELEQLPLLEELNLGKNPPLEKGNMGLGHMGPKTRQLCDKRSLLASKGERQALIARALGLRKKVLQKEQQAVVEEMRQKAEAEEAALMA